MELRFETAEGYNVPPGCYVGVRVGDVLKQGRYEPQRCYHFPSIERRRNAKIEIYRHIGSCVIAVDPDAKSSHEFSVASTDPTVPQMKLKVNVQSTGVDSGKTREARMKALKKQAKDYFSKYQIEEKLSEAVKALLKEQPANPTEYLCRHLMSSEGSAFPSAVTSPVAKAKDSAPSVPVKSAIGQAPGKPTGQVAMKPFAPYYKANVLPQCTSPSFATIYAAFPSKKGAPSVVMKAPAPGGQDIVLLRQQARDVLVSASMNGGLHSALHIRAAGEADAPAKPSFASKPSVVETTTSLESSALESAPRTEKTLSKRSEIVYIDANAGCEEVSLDEVCRVLQERASKNEQLRNALSHLQHLKCKDGAVPKALADCRNQELCQEYFDNSSFELQDKMTRIHKMVCKGKRAMSVIEFQRLHDVVKELVKPFGGFFFPPHYSGDVQVDFDAIDFNDSELVELPEILMWLNNLHALGAQHFEPWRELSFIGLLSMLHLRFEAKEKVKTFENAREWMLSANAYGDCFRYIMNDEKGSVQIPTEYTAPAVQPESITCSDDLIREAERLVPAFIDLGDELKRQTNSSMFAMGPLKFKSRVEEKIKKDYEGDARQIKDVLRMSIVCADVAMMRSVIEGARNSEFWEVSRVKSSFDVDAPTGQMGGYRDVKLFVRHRSSGYVAEVQVHHVSYYMLKREGGHALYGWARQKNVLGITSADDVMDDVSGELISEMIIVLKDLVYIAIKSRVFREELKMRILLFEAARLARDDEIIEEQGKILLGYVGYGSSPDSSHSMDAVVKREIVLALSRAPKFNISMELRMQLLRDQLQEFDGLMGWTSTAEKLVQAQCKIHMGYFGTGTLSREESVGVMKDGIKIMTEGCGLAHDHPAAARADMYMGSVLLQYGEISEAAVHLKSAEQKFEQLFGVGDHRTGDVYLELSTMLKLDSDKDSQRDAKRAKQDESLKYLDKCMFARRTSFGEEDMKVGNVYLHMADVKRLQEDYEAALRDFGSCKAIWVKSGKAKKPHLQTLEEREMFSRMECFALAHDANEGLVVKDL